MSEAMRTTLTLLGLVLLLVLAAVWGWSATLKPLPGKVDSPICVDTPVSAGEKIFPQQVAVSVYNAGRREGLAGRTMQQLKDAGFTQGNAGNAQSARVSRAEIWTTEPNNPAVRLVASYLGEVEILSREGPGVGVTVIVGDRFDDLAKGRRAVVAKTDTEICSPPVT